MGLIQSLLVLSFDCISENSQISQPISQTIWLEYIHDIVQNEFAHTLKYKQFGVCRLLYKIFKFALFICSFDRSIYAIQKPCLSMLQCHYSNSTLTHFDEYYDYILIKFTVTSG